MSDDPRGLLIEFEIELGQKALERLKGWGFTTLGDLADAGAVTEYSNSERNLAYVPALADVKGVGPVRIKRIRLALRRHGLALMDEEVISRWQPLEGEG